MDILFTIVPITGSLGVTLTNTSTSYTRDPTASLKLYFTGTFTGNLVTYELSAEELILWDAKYPITMDTADITGSTYTVLPDDFYRIQVKELIDAVITLSSGIQTISSYTYVLNLLNDKVVHTDRILNFVEKQNLHAMFIHIRALEVLGSNPPISMEDKVVSTLKFLKTI